MKTTLLLAGLLGAAGAASAQGFTMEGAVLDSRTSQNLGVSSEHGQLAEFFKAQKAMTFGILRAAGISLDQLSPEVRARIERFQTTNLDAFRAYSQGLDLKDQGRFQEAKEAFRRAAELDPGFTLAVEQQQAMPDVNVGSALQMRAVIAAASTNAVDRGKASFTVDLAHAMAALSSGQTVIATVQPAAVDPTQSLNSLDYTSNLPGSGTQLRPNLAAAIAYPATTSTGDTVNVAFGNEYTSGQYAANGNVLNSIQTTDAQGNTFQAVRGGAATSNPQEAVLSDGSKVYWGQWLSSPGAAAAISVNGQPQTAATPGTIDYMMGEATRQMPTRGTGTYTPTGGSLGAVVGNIGVDFGARAISLNNLGFTLGGYSFSGLNGSASYANAASSGGFSGTYSSGSCTGCTAFNPQAGSFGGNFVGQNAGGLIFSTILPTGTNYVSGVHLFTSH